MSTRSFIGKKIGNKVKYFFCHWDGYVDGKTGVGFTLNKYYNDERTVDELFDSVGGHIESLEKTPEETVADLQKLAKEEGFEKELEEDQQKIVNFYTYLRSCVGDIEWVYLYDDGEWFYTMYDMRGFHSLKDSLNDWGHYVVYRDKDKQYFCSGDEEAAWDFFANFEKLNKECLQLVDARTGKQIAADYMWREKYGDEEIEEHYSRRGRMLKEGFDEKFKPYVLHRWFDSKREKWMPAMVYTDTDIDGPYLVSRFMMYDGDIFDYPHKPSDKNKVARTLEKSIGTDGCDEDDVKNLVRSFVSDCREENITPKEVFSFDALTESRRPRGRMLRESAEDNEFVGNQGFTVGEFKRAWKQLEDNIHNDPEYGSTRSYDYSIYVYDVNGAQIYDEIQCDGYSDALDTLSKYEEDDFLIEAYAYGKDGECVSFEHGIDIRNGKINGVY